MSDLSYDAVKRLLKNQRIALIGGAGFIGHNVALELRRVGAEVMVVDNLMINSLIENVYDPERDPVQRELYQSFLLDRFLMMRQAGIILHNCDARQYVDLNLALTQFQPTKLVHFAGMASAVEAARQPELCFDLTLITLRNTLEWARHHFDLVNQVMFMSSSTVYGDFEEPVVDENVRPRPKGIYANTKYMGERLVRTYRDAYKLGTSIIRPSALYGERCISRRVSQVFVENALTGKPLPLEGGGEGRLDFTYIGDLVDGIVRALAFHQGQHSSSTYNITFGNARTIAELAAIIAGVVPGTQTVERPRPPEKPIRGTLSIERARQRLGFVPRFPLEIGYRRYCEWYLAEWERVNARVNR
jgi:nucleoside-diphosphate-sugar epimerase